MNFVADLIWLDLEKKLLGVQDFISGSMRECRGEANSPRKLIALIDSLLSKAHSPSYCCGGTLRPVHTM